MKNRRLWVALACALGFHVALLFGFRSPVPTGVLVDSSQSKTLSVSLKELPTMPVEKKDPDPLALSDEEVKKGNPLPRGEELLLKQGPSDMQVDLFSEPIRVELSLPKVWEQGISSGAANGTLQETLGSKPIIPASSLDRMPSVRSQNPPAYPAKARSEGLEGEVDLEFVVDTSGQVVEARVLRSSQALFEEPSLRAVFQWRFEPGKKKGRIVAFKMRQLLTFNLDR